jgi:uncharacterized protein YdeI (YjbR/CyaY-like superfamily)
MIASDRFQHVEVASEAALLAWLEAHHDQPDSVWLVTWKKQVPEKYVSREAVLDALTAYGWTDGLMRKIDDARVMQLVAPRRQQRWAQSYKDRAERLVADGRMQPAGLAAIARAKAAGLWDAMAEVDALTVPPDLADALGRCSARVQWDVLPPSYRRNVLRWLALARTAGTRAKRIKAVTDSAAAHRRLPQM